MKIKKIRIPVFDIIAVPILILLCFVTIYPFMYCLAYSLSDSVQAMIHNITVFPVGFTMGHYNVVFHNPRILSSFFITLNRTLLGILYAVCVTGLAAYSLSKPLLPFNRAISLLLIIPMYISGGLIPYYVLIVQLGLINNFWVYVLPHGFAAFNMLIMRTYFQTIPASLEESAKLDGAGDLVILVRIIAPLTMPIVATIAMFVGVFHWNSWFDGMIYTTKPELKPLQTLLQQLLLDAYGSATNDMKAMAYLSLNQKSSPESLKMATVMVTVLPIVMIYPFFQRYFVKGIMIGAIKA